MNPTPNLHRALRTAQLAFWSAVNKELGSPGAGMKVEIRKAFDQACINAVLDWASGSQREGLYEVLVSQASADTLAAGLAERVLVVSTGHIPNHTAKALGRKPGEAAASTLSHILSHVEWFEYGWLIACVSEHADQIADDHPELAELMRICGRAGISYLQLDCDGTTMDGLPTFSW